VGGDYTQYGTSFTPSQQTGYDVITAPLVDVCLSCKQAEVIQNHENENVRYIGQGEAPHRKYKRLKLGGGHV
jgi:hypothetical protein